MRPSARSIRCIGKLDTSLEFVFFKGSPVMLAKLAKALLSMSGVANFTSISNSNCFND